MQDLTTGELRLAIQRAYRMDEQACLHPLLEAAGLSSRQSADVRDAALALVRQARESQRGRSGVDAFMREYDLSTEEGVLLMCLAEALLRIPDEATADRLIRDRLAMGRWDEHLGRSASLWVNASTWGLLLSGRLLSMDRLEAGEGPSLLRRLVARSGEPVVRLALRHAMALLARQFVLGRDLREALAQTDELPSLCSFDCLGEAARTEADAQRYFHAYADAISRLGGQEQPHGDPLSRHGISIKLSALHPRYEFAQRERVMAELAPRLLDLVRAARNANVAVTLDAEEADRLDLSLEVFATLFADTALTGWNGVGLAVQAYQKRAMPVLRWLEVMAREHRRRLPVRLVKGAYWDTEIKRAQERGLDGYPVFTRKWATDVSYLACARFLLAHPASFYPQFATHNAHTLAYLLEVGRGIPFELQRLHGMGEELYEALARNHDGPPCRVYAPIGRHEELLPYLVRRLLENGANTSFVNQLGDHDIADEELVIDPVQRLKEVDCSPHPDIPLPADLYAPERRNSQGLDLSDALPVQSLHAEMDAAWREAWTAAPVIGGRSPEGPARRIPDPADPARSAGTVVEAVPGQVGEAFAVAYEAAFPWDAGGGAARARLLRDAADRLEADRSRLMAMIVREGGRTLPDALSEVREAADFCRYYALQAERHFSQPAVLPGPTGESNELRLHGRGVIACISPWNFPLAIFTGQVAAALAAGNAVIAKPARQTPLVAARAVTLLHEAGIPREVLHFLPGPGAELGAAILDDPRLAGVVFTGSTATARILQRGLAEREGPILPLIAETGGLNVMIADSSALPEQLVADVLQSAFNSAGQRCSALRVLFVQEEIAEPVIAMLRGAMAELRCGDPGLLSTDVGPVIDETARAALERHCARMDREARCLMKLDAPQGSGSFFAPRLYELDAMAALREEVFGPVLHLIRYGEGALDAVIDQLNGSGYGLTCGVHSRIAATWERVRQRARVGNLYVNRNMIGAVVGVQPFGGEGLSGTGPKAGGPHYLPRLAVERSVSVNTAALGGNARLLTL